MKIAKYIKSILSEIGENPNREGLKQTPERVERAFEEWFRGYQEPEFSLTTFSSTYKGIVGRKDIPFQSFCEHHIASYKGMIDFAYIPNGKIIGLSKIPRFLQHYSAKLTVQEELTDDLIERFYSLFPSKYAPLGTIIIIKGRHSCEQSRGVKIDALTITSAIRGKFLTEPEARAEVLSLLK